MAFILSIQLEDDVVAAIQRYRDYLAGLQTRFPPSAFALATSDWYFGFGTLGAPHDAHLQSVTVSELPSLEDDAFPIASIRIRLVSAHGGIIEFYYPRVFCYNMECHGLIAGHSDWRYDEFRLTDDNHVIHEIEWWHQGHTARWLIESSDVHHQYHAIETGAAPSQAGSVGR